MRQDWGKVAVRVKSNSSCWRKPSDELDMLPKLKRKTSK